MTDRKPAAGHARDLAAAGDDDTACPAPPWPRGLVAGRLDQRPPQLARSLLGGI